MCYSFAIPCLPPCCPATPAATAASTQTSPIGLAAARCHHLKQMSSTWSPYHSTCFVRLSVAPRHPPTHRSCSRERIVCEPRRGGCQSRGMAAGRSPRRTSWHLLAARSPMLLPRLLRSSSCRCGRRRLHRQLMRACSSAVATRELMRCSTVFASAISPRSTARACRSPNSPRCSLSQRKKRARAWRCFRAHAHVAENE